MTTRPTRVEINCETGIQSIVELTDEEIAQREKDAAAHAEAEALRATEAERIETLKKSAKTKLIAGEPLTEEEAATLVI